jgi:hypothetical protein
VILKRIRPSNLVLLAAAPFLVFLFASSSKYLRSLKAIIGIEPGAPALLAGFLLLLALQPPALDRAPPRMELQRLRKRTDYIAFVRVPNRLRTMPNTIVLLQDSIAGGLTLAKFRSCMHRRIYRPVFMSAVLLRMMPYMWPLSVRNAS